MIQIKAFYKQLDRSEHRKQQKWVQEGKQWKEVENKNNFNL